MRSVKIAFSENIKRENLNPIELGKMYKTYMTYLPQTETKNKKEFVKPITKLRDEVGKEFNVSIFTVKSYISLLDLPEAIKSLIVLNHGDNKKFFGDIAESAKTQKIFEMIKKRKINEVYFKILKNSS